MKRVIALCALVMSAAGCAGSVAPLPPPPSVSVAPTSSSIPDYSNISLPAASGTTAVPGVSVRPGSASIAGTVRLNGAAIPNAVVHLDRFVGASTASLDLVTGADGTYSASGIAGGRYRVRAYRAPDATMAQPQILFLGSTENKSLDLALTSFNGGQAVSYNIAPSPPLIGFPANFVVSITTQGVDNSGVARSVGVPNVPVRLDSAGGRAITSGNVTTTDASGRAYWQLQCVDVANQGLTLTFADGSTQDVNVAGCQVPPPTTTTTEPTSAPPAGR